MYLKRTCDNDQAIFRAFNDVKVNKNFNVLYEEFEDCCSSICGCINNPISYLMRNNLIPKDEADNTEKCSITLDLHIIQSAGIVKAANVHDVNLEHSGARAR